MPDMVDRVAAAIIQFSKSFDGPYPTTVTQELARTVIETMREPTDEMCNAANIRRETIKDMNGRWKAMIDAALKEKTDA